MRFWSLFLNCDLKILTFAPPISSFDTCCKQAVRNLGDPFPIGMGRLNQ